MYQVQPAPRYVVFCFHLISLVTHIGLLHCVREGGVINILLFILIGATP